VIYSQQALKAAKSLWYSFSELWYELFLLLFN